MLMYNMINRGERGRIFHVTANTTPGTGIAGQTATAFSDTAATFALFNQSKQDHTGKLIVPSYLKLVVTATGATSVSLQSVFAIDSGARGTTSNVNAVYGNHDSDANATLTLPDSDTFIQFGALTPSAASAKRTFFGRSAVKTQATPCLALGDEYLFIFGQSEQGLGPLNGAVANRIVVPAELVTIGPQGLLLLHLWMPSNSGAPSFEYDLAYYKY